MADKGIRRGEVKKILDELATKRTKKIITTSVRSGRRADVIVVGKRGHYVRHRKPVDAIVRDIAILPTIEAAIMRSGRDFQIAREDFREKVRRKKISTLICIVFDGSSSMVKDDKIGSIKEILDELLLDAYQKRDRVSLVVYSGQDSNVVLPFTTSVESAKILVERIQYGGTTPLSSGILTGLQMLDIKMLSEPESIPIMVVITDGSTNVPIVPGADVHRELIEACQTVKESGVNTLVIDVCRGGAPVAKEIADVSGARYFVVRSGTGEDERIDMVNQEIVKYALSLLMVDNSLGHMLVRGCSSANVESVLNDIDEMGMEIESVEGCKYNCDPKNPVEFCPECAKKYSKGKTPLKIQRLRIVRIDSAISVDELKGYVDEKGFTPGFFALANRGLLYIDGVDKLEAEVVRVLIRTLITKVNLVETEDIPIIHPAKFVLVGRVADDGSSVNAQLLGHISMLVDTKKMSEIERRIRKIEQQKDFDTDSKKFKQTLKKKNKENLFRIIRAKGLLNQIKTPDAQLDVIGRICVESSVASNYLDGLIEMLARASAAYDHRNTMEMKDVIAASEFVLPLYTNRNAAVARGMSVIQENIDGMKEWVSKIA